MPSSRGSGNRRIRAVRGTDDANDNGNSKSGKRDKTCGQNRVNMKARRDRPRKPKSRSYKDLQRKIQKKREKIANRQTNWERHASKEMADGASTVAMEDLNLKNMTAKAKGKGSSAKRGLNREMAYSRPRMFQRQIEQSCANAGVIVITVDPKGTSTTCHKCGHNDSGSRISQAEFQCTNHDCGIRRQRRRERGAQHCRHGDGRAAGIVVPRREIPGRDCSRTPREQHARDKHGRDRQSARKRQKSWLLLYVIPPCTKGRKPPPKMRPGPTLRRARLPST